LFGWSVAGVESRHRRRRSPSTGTVEQKLGHDPSSRSWNVPDYRRQATLRGPRPDRRTIASDTEQRSTSIRDEYRASLSVTADAESLAAPGGAVEIRPEQQRTVNPAELSSSRDLAEGLARADHREHHGVPQHGSDADDEPPALDESEQWLGAA
jgi:hypothetical protein